MTTEMIAAGWAVLRRQQPVGRIFGTGPALVEAYEAMRALEPKHISVANGPKCPTCGFGIVTRERPPLSFDEY